MSRFQPEVGDVGVKGTARVIRNKFQQDFAIGGCGFFDVFVTANGYDSIAQNLFVPMLSFFAPDIPVGIESGDNVTAEIAQGEYGLYATNITKL